MKRTLVTSPSPWEKRVGFSRAVRVGPHVFVAGTAPVSAEGNSIAPGDPYEQTRAVFRIIERALNEAGAELRHVVRTRMFVTDMSVEDDVARAHAELFADIRPAATMVAIRGLVRDDLFVEIEVDAFIHDEPQHGETPA